MSTCIHDRWWLDYRISLKVCFIFLQIRQLGHHFHGRVTSPPPSTFPSGSFVCVPWWVETGWVSSCGSRGDRQWWLRTTENWWRRHNWSGCVSLRHTVLLWWPSTVREQGSFKDHVTEESWWHEASASSQHLHRRAGPGWECSSLGGS